MVHDILVSIVLGWHISGEAGGGALNICPVWLQCVTRH